VVQALSNEYFDTQRRYDAGRPVPGAWRIYYDETVRGDDNAGQDLLLASNAHTNHDLPYAYASVVQAWRENAWRQTEALVAARDDPGLLRIVEDEIETTSVAWANTIRSVQVPGYRAVRDAYCRAHPA
jgi:hypothetical protein